MQIALTADLHLTIRAEHPERYAALEDILTQMQATGIDTLIIAGDLFDVSRQNYAEFEAVCKAHPAVFFYIVPGNHDPALSSRQIVAPNIRIITQPEIVRLGPTDQAFFFLPYEKNRTMGERIAEYFTQLPPDDWVLVAHGDWMDGLREANPYEDGFYMPFSRKDRIAYRPAKVFLGHIHARLDSDRVYYPGSPCGLDIGETGPRRFLVYDSLQGSVESRRVMSEVVFFDETLTVIPLEDESAGLRRKADEIIRRWGLDTCDHGRVRLRLRVNGYSIDHEALLRTVKECFAGFAFYKGGEPDISSLNSSTDPDRSLLAETVGQAIVAHSWPTGSDDPQADEILQAALNIIYGEK